MASLLVSVAQELETHLAGGVPYVIDPIDLERRWLPYLDRVSIGFNCKVSVVPNGSTQQIWSRSQRRNEIVVDVFVQQAIDWQTSAEGDHVAELAEQLNDRVWALDSVTVGSKVIGRVGVTFEPFVVGEQMTELNLFTSRITTRWLSSL